MLVLIIAIVAALASTTPCRAQSGARRATVEAFRFEPNFSKQREVGAKLVAAGDVSVLPALEDLLLHEDRHVRANVAFVFASFGDPRGLQALEAIVNDHTPRPWGQGGVSAPSNMTEGWQLKPTAQQTQSDRYYAVHVLGSLRDQRALRTLLPLLGDRDIGYAVAWALGEIGDRSAVEPLIEMLSDPDAFYRVSAVDAIAKLGAVEAIPALLTLRGDDARSNTGDLPLVSERALAAIAYLESLAHSAPVAQTRDDSRPPASVRFLNVEELMDKATAPGCRISGTWWCRVGCPVRGIRQEVRIEPDLSDLPAVPSATLIAELGVDDTGRVRDACVLRGLRPDVDREVIRR